MSEDEANLWKDCREKVEAACKQLVVRYLPLARSWAARIARVANWTNQDDLFQEGVIGLINAVKNFDLSKGTLFTRYASYYVRGAILDSPELTQNLARRQQEFCGAIRRAEQELTSRLQRIPTLEEVAEQTGLREDQILNAMDAMGLAFADTLAEDSEPLFYSPIRPSQQTSAVIHDALARLSPQEQAIIAAGYFEGLSDAESAARFNRTEASVKKARQRAISKLQRLLGD